METENINCLNKKRIVLPPALIDRSRSGVSDKKPHGRQLLLADEQPQQSDFANKSIV